jgi:hypothetical protein
MDKRKASERTSYEVRKRWDKENQKIYSVRLRLKDDADLISFIESRKQDGGTSQLFRSALELLIKNEG